MENIHLKNDKLRLLKSMNHMVCALLAMKYNTRGHLEAVSTASSAGAVAIGHAYRLIKYGYAEIMITGGLDFNLSRSF